MKWYLCLKNITILSHASNIGRFSPAMKLLILSIQLNIRLAQSCKSNWQKQYNWRFRANPTDKYASQWSSEAEPRSFTGEHICQLDLQGIADYRSLSGGFATLDNLRCWKDINLHTTNRATLSCWRQARVNKYVFNPKLQQ